MSGVIKFVKRGGNPVVTITQDDLAATNSIEEVKDILTIDRTQESELPNLVNVGYINKDFSYQQGVQFSQRMATNSINKASIDLPIAISDDKAKSIADAYLYNAWTARNLFSLSFSTKYKYIEPTDIIQIQTDNASHLLLVVKSDDSLTGVIELQCVSEDQSNYIFTSQGGVSEEDEQIIYTLSKTRLVFLDINLLRDVDDNNGTYIAIAGYNDGWPGCVIYRSSDGGQTYTSVVALTGINATMGNTINVLGSGRTDIFDETNSVDINLPYGGSLSSASELSVFSGSNAVLIGNEILQFKNVEQLTANTYRLSGLLRGRRGTEHEVGNHAVGDLVVFLNNGIARLALETSDISLEQFYKAVTIEDSINDTLSSSFTFANTGKECYAPAHVIGVQSNSAGNCVLRWVRRTRAGGEWRDRVDASLAETSEAYELEILDEAGDVVRTVTGLTAATYTYLIADQNTDFPLGIPTTINVRVYQISSIVGRGYPGLGTITRY